MRQFLLVVRFELETMMKKKSFILSIVLIALAAFILLSMPRFFDNSKKSDNQEVTNQEKDKVMMIYDEKGIVKDSDLITQAFTQYHITFESDLSVIKNKVEDGSADAGIQIKSPLEFVYYVKNSSLNDETAMRFQSVLQKVYQLNELII